MDTLVNRDGFVSQISYSPDGQKVLIKGSPECLGGIGNVVPQGISDITKVTDMMISNRPMAIRDVMTSPKTDTPITTAVTGSNAPRMAVGVAPIYWIALVVHTSESMVGNTARHRMLIHNRHSSVEGTWKSCVTRRRLKNNREPKVRT